MGRNDAARGREHVESPGDLHVDESRHSSVHFAYPIVQCWPRIARQWAEKKGDIDLRPALLSYLVSNPIQDGFAATAAGVTNPIGSVTAAIADAQLTAIGVTCA
ncbi:MAG: hypothetical protein DMF44_04955 [Verrucomicrobia bacterium]|nr:MAG: hypothetical protein DMF44_04955 [Verrucomicrobiota bacterium]